MPAFWSRIVVSVALLPIVLGIVWLGGWWLFALALGGVLFALHELYAMARAQRPVVLAGYLGAVLTLLGVQLGGVSWMLGGLLATLALSFLVWGISSTRQSASAAISLTVLSVAWIGAGLGCFLLLRTIPDDGRLVVFTVLIAVFADDTCAYFVGRLVGRHRLAPAISPGKSWEGFVAGTIASMAVAFFALYDQHYISSGRAIAFGFVVALASASGDLFESAIKRDLGVKDSGRILGGHGGVLDRIDSLLWAGPAAYFFLLASGHV
jgi:phosphatidate cytidylyltransferase